MLHKLSHIVTIGLIILLDLSCTSETGSTRNLTLDSFTRPTLETVFEFTESPEVAFQQISSIKTDNHGNILVRDFRQPALFMFNMNGDFLQKIGQEGRGPGEFQQIIDFAVIQNHLWILDSGTYKIEKFKYQDTKYVHVKSISLQKEELAGGLLGKTQKGILIKNMVGIYANRNDKPTERPISLIDENGGIRRDSIFTVPLRKEITLRGPNISLSINKIFGNRSLLAFDGIGRIYALWTDSLAIDTYTTDGDRRRVFSYALDPVRVTDEERDSVLNRYDFARADLRQKLPDAKPIVYNLRIDDQQRIWVELLTQNLGHGWFCFTKKGEPLYKIDIPKKGAELQEISGNRVLWDYQNEAGAPTMVVSKINIPGI